MGIGDRHSKLVHLCSGHAKLTALLSVLLPHLCIREHLPCVVALRLERALAQSVRLCSGQAKLIAPTGMRAVLPHSLHPAWVHSVA